MTFGFGFTGYSLVYEQLSYWAAVVGTNIAAATPLIGGTLARFMRGGDEIGANTLTRFFVFHVGILPTAIFMLIGLHILQIRLHGVSVPEDLHATEEGGQTFPFFPDHFYTELVLVLSHVISGDSVWLGLSWRLLQ